MKPILFVISFLVFTQALRAQTEPEVRKENIRNSRSQSTSGQGTQVQGIKGQGTRKDSLGFERRDDAKDSISVIFRYLDATRRQTLDSGIRDFDRYFSIPLSWIHLGNNGQAAKSLIFQPFDQPGWDPGFHAFDLYRFTIGETRFYKTRRPFSSLSYQLASGKEQVLKASHTQNPMPNLNVGFDYRLINAPGFFVSQNTNHNNFRFFGQYQGKRKRYNGYFVWLGNTIRASQNGGIQNDSLLADPNRKDRFSVPVNLGQANAFTQNPFSTTVNTGHQHKEIQLLFRNSYDIGKRDSIAINDSTTEYLFYPKLRLQHSFQYSNYRYRYKDIVADSLIYQSWYNLTLNDKLDTVLLEENWNMISNEFSLYQFPDTKNPAQFFKAGITHQLIEGTLRNGREKFSNLFILGEYRNRTRNKAWEINVNGSFYVTGLQGGDYKVQASLDRFFNKKWGNLKLFFSNSSRTPSFIFDPRSSFRLDNGNTYSKENITSFGATADNEFISLGFTNHLLANYVYIENYKQTNQYSKPINIIQAYARKNFKLTRYWNWYAEIHLQQTDGAAPIKVPLLYTRQRIAYEGRFYKNLNLSTGVEVRYVSPYKADGFSPIMARFTPQDTLSISNRPDLAAFVHLRIKGFTGYIRAENLNTANFSDGFSFTNNNFAGPLYPTQGFIFRFGIQWWFVN